MKSATSTLQEQLAQQPGIYMCSPKEPNFFSDDCQFAKGIGWYSNLFSMAPSGSLLGEASTHYTKLPTYPHSAERLKKYLPNARFIYVLRHPIDRLISHYIHGWSMGDFKCSLEDAVQSYSELIDYGQYAMQLEPYFELFGRERVLPVFFDRLIQNSQTELERICEFIGYYKKPHWNNSEIASNVSSERVRRFPLYKLIVESSVATTFRRTFVPKRWRNVVKAKFSMGQRPVLTNDTIKKISLIFDKDLNFLGSELDVELNCSNFKEVTVANSLNWKNKND